MIASNFDANRKFRRMLYELKMSLHQAFSSALLHKGLAMTVMEHNNQTPVLDHGEENVK